ncbi:hypothetical protein PX554_20530 [Sphingomonas sp. H39-1-10]|uniref:MutS-related protein n=1 Tax=Sphingomonas pollutisoli TaxID=3030829 RepID=UPI0023BA1618|nr:hypothetical protein [Sphingomonas pollutisoli]MDF0490521.1 hypothetical protein [Sphingomonas pollutisoli]
MKAYLLFPDRESDWRWVSRSMELHELTRSGRRAHGLEDFRPDAALPWNADALIQDLGLNSLFSMMADGADDIFVAVRRELLTGVANDLEVVRYRQAMLADVLANPRTVRALHSLATEGIDLHRHHFLGTLSRDYPDTVLRWAIDLLRDTLATIAKLRSLAGDATAQFQAPGWLRFFSMIETDLNRDYVAQLAQQLDELRLRDGLTMSASLKGGNVPGEYRLHQSPVWHQTWLQRLLRRWFPSLFREELGPFGFSLAPSDESGNRALREFANRGVAIAAEALGNAAGSLKDFFEMLRAETAFYVGCLTLHEALNAADLPTCMPDMALPAPSLDCDGLYEPLLGLHLDGKVVPSDVHARGRSLVVITGANQGGKSTLLRSIGVAQLMAQCGMYVPARRFAASLCGDVLTHYKREEDAGLVSGKFDEELARVSDIVDHFRAGALMLLNESFASTTEREGSDIADDIVESLCAGGARVVFVTHLYEYAHRAAERHDEASLFLRADRDDQGRRSFRILEGEPLRTSFGEDLYRKIFEGSTTAIDTA